MAISDLTKGGRDFHFFQLNAAHCTSLNGKPSSTLFLASRSSVSVTSRFFGQHDVIDDVMKLWKRGLSRAYSTGSRQGLNLANMVGMSVTAMGSVVIMDRTDTSA